MAESGDVNVLTGYLGTCETGKSTLALTEAYRKARELGAFLIIMDNTHNIKTRVLKSGGGFQDLDAVHSKTMQELSANVANRPRAVQVVHVLEIMSIIDFARKLRLASKRYVVLLVDEMVLVDEATGSRTEFKPLKQAVSIRRWDGIAYFWTTQSPYSVQRLLLSIASEIKVFRIEDDIDLRRLTQVKFTKEQVEEIRHLPDHHFVTRKNY